MKDLDARQNYSTSGILYLVSSSAINLREFRIPNTLGIAIRFPRPAPKLNRTSAQETHSLQRE